MDTNILLHAVNPDSPDAPRCAAAVTSLVNGTESWALTWGILYEFMRVSTHQRIFPTPLTVKQAHGFVEDWVSAADCAIIAESGYHRQALVDCLSEAPRLSGNILHDFHIAVLMREHGITEIFTFDQDFHTFPWIAIRPPPELEAS